jgi:hypothetical protein
MIKIIDTNNETTSRLDELRDQGVECIIRYISTNTGGSKVVKPAEARAIAAAGLKLALVFEVWGGVNNFAHDDIDGDSGASHGDFARQWAANGRQRSLECTHSRSHRRQCGTCPAGPPGPPGNRA